TLEEVYINNNEIKNISRMDIANLTRLFKIELSGNQISSIETSCFKGTTLRWISLNNNKLTDFPDFSEVKDTIEEVYINNNEIKNISRMDIANLTRLFKIDLSHNQISSIETSCFKGTTLRWISLNNNKLTDFPDFSKVRDTIEEVYINNNEIKNISRMDIANLTSLFKIDLSYNQISSIETSCFKGTILRWISLNNNKLTDFPDFSKVKDTI
ncbi:hypothetical protein CAPTEDRAFT_71429, partial [Capitella teleta]